MVGLLALLFVVGCNNPNEIGSNLVDTDFADYFDSLGVSLSNAPRDTVTTDESLFFMVGNYNDPLVGHVAASFYTQFLLTGTNVFFGAPATLRYDSLVLFITYRGATTGDPTLSQNLVITELADSLERAKTYFSTDEVRTQAVNLVESSTKLRVRAAGSAEIIGLRLNRTLGEKLLYAPASAMLNNTTFHQFFPGLKVSTLRNPDALTGAALVLDRINITRMRLYYTDLSTNQQKFYDYSLNNSAAGFTQYELTETAGRLYEQTMADPSGLGRQYLFAHSGLGFQIRGRIGNPTGPGKLPINRAILSLPVEDVSLTDSLLFRRPLLQIFANEADSITPNLNTVIANAEYNPATRSYEFNITRYLQHLNLNKPIYFLPDENDEVQGVRNTGFTILPANRNYTLDRIILSGPASTRKPKLKVYFTPLPS